MALTNIELYEALKKDLNEEAARMIAEAVPKAGDLATKADIAELTAATKADIAELSAATKADIAELKSYIDSRLLRFSAVIVVPMVLTLLGTVGALIALVIKI